MRLSSPLHSTIATIDIMKSKRSAASYFLLPLFSVATIIAGVGCSGENGFGNFGKGLLSSTGLMSGSQADAIFSAGEKLGKAASPLSGRQEHFLGRAVAANILSQYPLYRNRAITAYVNKVGRTVAAFSSKPETYGGYHFAVLDTEELNAVSAPDGYVFVSRGLLRILPNEDALAAVLAHEVGHVALGHGVHAVSQGNLTEAVTILGKEAASSYGGSTVQQLTGAFGGSVTDVVNTVLKEGYSRSQEYDADEYAAQLLLKSGYDPHGLLQVLEQLEKSKAGKAGGWLSTHPKPEDRIDHVKSSIKGGGGDGEAIRTARFRAVLSPH